MLQLPGKCTFSSGSGAGDSSTTGAGSSAAGSSAGGAGATVAPSSAFSTSLRTAKLHVEHSIIETCVQN